MMPRILRKFRDNQTKPMMKRGGIIKQVNSIVYLPTERKARVQGFYRGKPVLETFDNVETYRIGYPFAEDMIPVSQARFDRKRWGDEIYFSFNPLYSKDKYGLDVVAWIDEDDVLQVKVQK